MEVLFNTVMLSLLMASLFLWGLLAWQWLLLRRIVVFYLTYCVCRVITLRQFYERKILLHGLLSQFSRGRSLSCALCQILPLQGLLGTVAGMIDIFTQLAHSSQNNEFNHGISLALLSTFAGLASSLPAIFVIFHLENHKVNYCLDFKARHPIGRVD